MTDAVEPLRDLPSDGDKSAESRPGTPSPPPEPSAMTGASSLMDASPAERHASSGTNGSTQVQRAATRAVPHWMRILVSLQGSSQQAVPGGAAEYRWTQQGIAARAGCSVKRVSEFPLALEDSAEGKLDRYVPGWRTRFSQGRPRLVASYRGVVEGRPGTWVYYRLTQWGERLAEALLKETPALSQPPSQTGQPA